MTDFNDKDRTLPNGESQTQEDFEADQAFDELVTADESSPRDHDGAGEQGGEPTSKEAGNGFLPSDHSAGENRREADNPSPQSQNPSNDIWANAPPELREAHEQAIRDANFRLQSATGRQTAAQRSAEALRQQIAELQGKGQGGDNPQRGGQQPDDDSNARTGATDDDIARIREEYPEMAPLAIRLEEQARLLNQYAGPMQTMAQQQQMAAIMQQVDVLAKDHPDWQVVGNDDRMAGWLETQPRAIQEAAARNSQYIVDGSEAALVLNLFKNAIGIPTGGQQQQPSQSQGRNDRRGRQLESGRDAGSSASRPHSSSVPDDEDSAFEFYRQRDEKRQRASM